MEASKGWPKLPNGVVLRVAVFRRCYLPVCAAIGWWSLCCIVWTYFPSPAGSSVCLALTNGRDSVCCAGGSTSCVLHPSLNNLHIFSHHFLWFDHSSGPLSHFQWSDFKCFFSAIWVIKLVCLKIVFDFCCFIQHTVSRSPKYIVSVWSPWPDSLKHTTLHKSSGEEKTKQKQTLNHPMYSILVRCT